MTLRLATENDFDDIVRMAKSFHDASPYVSLEFSEGKCREFFNHYLRGDRKEVIIILAHAEERVFGMIIGYASSTPFSDNLVASEVAWWVDEDMRQSRDSLLLFKAYEDWALRINVKITQMAMLDNSTNLQNFYSKQGYSPAERSYIKRTG